MPAALVADFFVVDLLPSPLPYAPTTVNSLPAVQRAPTPWRNFVCRSLSRLSSIGSRPSAAEFVAGSSLIIDQTAQSRHPRNGKPR